MATKLYNKAAKGKSKGVASKMRRQAKGMTKAMSGKMPRMKHGEY